MQTIFIGWLERLKRWKGSRRQAAELPPSPSIEAASSLPDVDDTGHASTAVSLSHTEVPPSTPPSPATPDTVGATDAAHFQVRQLIKQALEEPTPDQFVEFIIFTKNFRRMGVWNARMAYIQRPGASVIATETEWKSVGRNVLPDAVPIIILWPFSPIRYVYELADTGPPVDRAAIGDPFAATGVFATGMLNRLVRELERQKAFKVKVELRRQGFNYAGSAAAQSILPNGTGLGFGPVDLSNIGDFASVNAVIFASQSGDMPVYRVTLNDRLDEKERFVTLAHELGHIFCGHLGPCRSRAAERDEDDSEAGWGDRRHIPKGVREIEAEAVAFLIASRAGLVTRSAAYLKPYLEKVKQDDVDLDVIVRAASRIERIGKISYGKMTFKTTGGG